ncbi:hypothetical protein [Paraburkholderia sp. BCC1886]|uniref:hypothetical protein n=1 Tax=Paraburkholderia sp. BCC1886 TaxID=2562670 RepID=UPI0011845627|nr:hypothetical protein [Paraburkholderia sp. BCC1886]
MPLRPAEPASFDALPNPRGGAVRAAELALAEALLAFEQYGESTSALLRASHALRSAGWFSAQRYIDALVRLSPVTADPSDPDNARPAFGAALQDFRAALERHNLRELACSPTLFDHYRSLCTQLSDPATGPGVTFDDLALSARAVPLASLHAQSADRLAHLRARFERALLPVLRSQASSGSAAVYALTQAALDEIDAVIAELIGPDPYDFWRLAQACAKSLRQSGRISGQGGQGVPSALNNDTDARRFYARCNLALADHARGVQHAPRSLVRATLALLWRDYALFGAAAEDAAHVDVLRDYGLTVDWHVAGTQDSEALWEAGALQAQAISAARSSLTRDLGVLTVGTQAYEDFLQTADAAISALTDHARAANHPDRLEPGAALQAGDAASRLGAAACALGLGHVAVLADTLGLAWRRRAHAAVALQEQHQEGWEQRQGQQQNQRGQRGFDAPSAATLEQSAEALRAMLHKVAAGVAPAANAIALSTLTRAIEHGGSGAAKGDARGRS